MSEEHTAVKCPECGANVLVETNREKMYCSYCGACIIMNNQEHIYRHIDEARIKEAEVRQALELKKLEIIEKSRSDKKKKKALKIIVSLGVGAVAILLMSSNMDMGGIIGLLLLEVVALIWIVGNNDDNDNDLIVGDKIKVPISIVDYEKKNYETIVEMFKCSGFSNVRSVPLQDLKTGILKKPGTVDSITINGRTITFHKAYSSNATVAIYYHSFPEK